MKDPAPRGQAREEGLCLWTQLSLPTKGVRRGQRCRPPLQERPQSGKLEQGSQAQLSQVSNHDTEPCPSERHSVLLHSRVAVHGFLNLSLSSLFVKC